MNFARRQLVVACAGSLQFGLAASALNTLSHHLALMGGWFYDPELEATTTSRLSALQTLFFVAAAFGCGISGTLLGYGRRTAMQIMQALFVVGGAVMAYGVTASFRVLLAGRIVCGIGAGIAAVACPIYMSEISPAAVRGARGTAHQIAVATGSLVSIALGMGLSELPRLPTPDDLAERDKMSIYGLLLLPSVLGIVASLLLSCVCTAETPVYLVIKHRQKEATEVLQRIHESERVERRLMELISETQARPSFVQSVGICTAMREPCNRASLIMGTVLAVGHQFSGISVFLSMSNSLFEGVGLPPKCASAISTTLAVVNVVMSVPAVFLVDRLGRRKLVLGGLATQTAALAVILASTFLTGLAPYLLFAGSVVFVGSFACTLGPVLWVYLAEIFPAHIKGSATGFATAANMVSLILVVGLSSYFSNMVAAKFSFFAVNCFVLLVFCSKHMKETAGSAASPYLPIRSQLSEEEEELLGAPPLDPYRQASIGDLLKLLDDSTASSQNQQAARRELIDRAEADPALCDEVRHQLDARLSMDSLTIRKKKLRV